MPTCGRTWRASLPDYMVPAAIIVLDALPVGPQREARPQGPAGAGLVGHAPQPARALRAPRPRPCWRRLWGELLGVTEVGVHDDFFELGGDSILGAKLLARIRDQLRRRPLAARGLRRPHGRRHRRAAAAPGPRRREPDRAGRRAPGRCRFLRRSAGCGCWTT